VLSGTGDSTTDPATAGARWLSCTDTAWPGVGGSDSSPSKRMLATVPPRRRSWVWVPEGKRRQPPPRAGGLAEHASRGEAHP
jgi:hypothetical protein